MAGKLFQCSKVFTGPALLFLKDNVVWLSQTRLHHLKLFQTWKSKLHLRNSSIFSVIGSEEKKIHEKRMSYYAIKFRSSNLQNVSDFTLRCFSTTIWRLKRREIVKKDDETSDSDEEIDESFLEDEKLKKMIREYYSLPGVTPRVLIILPNVKWGPKKKRNTTAQLQLEEAIALVDTLNWKVAKTIIKSTKTPDYRFLFGRGNFQELTKIIQESPGISAVFMAVNMLTGRQHCVLEKHWNLPVFDRYSVVLQIFKEHAQTVAARLQIALAEIPYIKSRIRQLHEGSLDQQSGGMQYIGGSGETYLDMRIRLLKERELKIRKELIKLKKHRELLRSKRKKLELPTVAVVGYTNAGKTSLIKALTKDSSLQPKDCLFATLDSTVHACILPHYLKVLFVDTIGFISDIPIHLVDSFAATLEDTLQADLLVHVRDVSHPDTVAQKENVLSTLKGLTIIPSVKENIIEVCNKCDLVPDPKAAATDNATDAFFISATLGTGLAELKQEIEERVIMATGRMIKSFKIPMGSPEYNWLCEEAAVYNVEVSPEDNFYNMHTIISEAAYGKFRHRFRKIVEIQSKTASKI